MKAAPSKGFASYTQRIHAFLSSPIAWPSVSLCSVCRQACADDLCGVALAPQALAMPCSSAPC
jgi:hypothetical protein